MDTDSDNSAPSPPPSAPMDTGWTAGHHTSMPPPIIIRLRDVETQTTPSDEDMDHSRFLFMLYRENKNNAAVQCSIPFTNEMGCKAVQPWSNIGQSTRWKSNRRTIVAELVPTFPPLPCRGFHGFTSITQDFQMVSMTGITLVTFASLLEYIREKNVSTLLENENALLLFLMKLKLGMSYPCLSVIFQISSNAVVKLFLKMLECLYNNTLHLIKWPAKAINRQIPVSFHLLDDDEDSQSSDSETDSLVIELKVLAYSDYMETNSLKVLIGVSSNGDICFKSKMYDGNTTDSHMVVDSGFLAALKRNDVVVTDIPLELSDSNAYPEFPKIVSPDSRFCCKTQTSPKFIAQSEADRCVTKLKGFQVFDHIHPTLLMHMNELVGICCVITNLIYDHSSDESSS